LLSFKGFVQAPNFLPYNLLQQINTTYYFYLCFYVQARFQKFIIFQLLQHNSKLFLIKFKQFLKHNKNLESYIYILPISTVQEPARAIQTISQNLRPYSKRQLELNSKKVELELRENLFVCV